MVKEPRPGRVKTRLGRDIGMVSAAWWFRHQCKRLIRNLRDPRWQIVLAVNPDRAGMTSRIWPRDLVRRHQGPGTLGDRMRRQMRQAVPGPVCVIGADIPGIRRHHIADAFHALGQHDAVIGPTPDGGYWLVGLKRPDLATPQVFSGVRWSTRHAMADTMVSLYSRRVVQIATLRDVDHVTDLRTDCPGQVLLRMTC